MISNTYKEEVTKKKKKKICVSGDMVVVCKTQQKELMPQINKIIETN